MKFPNLLGLDTNCFIYWQEHDGGRRAEFLQTEVFLPMATGRQRAVTSQITLVELLVPAFRANDHARARNLSEAIAALPGLRIRDVDQAVAERAAAVRASNGMQLGDALQVAAAAESGAPAFLTNDRRLFRDVSGIDVLLLDDLVAAWPGPA
jgi:predicted nucleic acid-binding protein